MLTINIYVKKHSHLTPPSFCSITHTPLVSNCFIHSLTHTLLSPFFFLWGLLLVFAQTESIYLLLFFEKKNYPPSQYLRFFLIKRFKKIMNENEWKGASFKQEEDHSAATKELLEKVNATTLPVLLRSSNKSVEDLIEELLVLEKTARLGGDAASSAKLAVEAIRIYRTRKELEKMLDLLDTLAKKRAQSKRTQSAMVEECAVVLHDGSLSKDAQEEVLKGLARVTDGKIHVELEHARFTIELAKLREAKNDKRGAFDMLRVLHIETITTMPRIEKLDALNQQIRLSVEIGDFDHTPLVSRKINHRALGRQETVNQKLLYFELMRAYYTHKKSFFNVARCWYETYLSLDDAEERLAALSNTVVHYLIAEHSTAKELEDLAECTAFSPATKAVDRIAALSALSEKRRDDLEDLPLLFLLLQRFNSIELIRGKTAHAVAEVCATHPQLAEFPERQKLLHDRSSEHDLLVASRFYTRIPLARLANLVGLTPDHTEQFLMAMVTGQSLYAKIDRVDGVVVFEAPKKTVEVISAWNEAVERSVALLDKASHLITKERMLHNMKAPKS